jgi:hypothetical protein
VQADRRGEFFEIVRQPGADAGVAVLDVQPGDRHLLLLVRVGKDKSKFLRRGSPRPCGTWPSSTDGEVR